MAGLGHVVPLSQQSAESFHGLRRTQEGLLYYTKFDKDGADIIDPEGGVPTDKNGGKQLPTKQDYTEEDFDFQSTIQYFAGNGSTTTFTLSPAPLDISRFQVYVNNIKLERDRDYTYSSPTLTIKMKPANGAMISVGLQNKKYRNNTNDKYDQYVFEDGNAVYFIDSDGYLVKRENADRASTALGSDDFSTAESSTYSVASTTYQDAV